MAKRVSWRRRTARAVVGATLLSGSIPAVAADAPPAPPQSAQLPFDLRPQPLEEALMRYNALTGYSVLIASDAIRGKQAAAVQGRHTAEEALHRLLAGTGLAPRFIHRRSVTLIPVAVHAEAYRSATDRSAEPAVRSAYDGALQNSIAQALCAQPLTGAGRHRIALRFWVDPQGRIDALKVSVDASPRAEPHVAAALSRLPVGLLPPGVAQPVLMVVQPQSARRYGGCPS